MIQLPTDGAALWRALVVVVALALAPACSPSVVASDGDADADTDGGGDGDSDTDVDSDTDTDVDSDADTDDDGDADGDGDTCELANFGEECDRQADCCPGLVCFSPEGDSRPSICTEWCEEECPEGYGCQVFNDGTGGEAEVCWYPENTLCNACDENVDCGEVRDLCLAMPEASDDLYCSVHCDPEDPDGCPNGFTCTLVPREISTYQCMPDDGVCCVDEDEDRFGRGDACVGTDCDDHDAEINPDADDVCDGLDNDCDGGIDNDPFACGTCRRCTSGACEDVPEGEDTHEHCGTVDCDLYYWGWETATNTCYRMGDVPATLAACDGDGACRTAETECILHGIQGTSTVRCDGDIGVCQDAEGCAGTEEGRCVDLDLGSETCGLGVCEITTERCIAGVEQTCTPGTGGTETCNDLDDDCDGVVDVSAVFDGLDPYEPNDDCNGHPLGTATASDSAAWSGVTGPLVLYPAGDYDYFTLELVEPFDLDCGIPFISRECYRVTVELTRAPDTPSARLCAAERTCSGQLCTTGSSIVIEYAGTCAVDDDTWLYFSVRDRSGTEFDCHEYSLRYLFETGFSGC